MYKRQLVQDHLASSLGKSATENGARLEGRILRFDRVVAGKSSKAVVALELRLLSGSKVVLSKTYQSEQQAADDTIAAHVVATEQALAAIYVEFVRDAER